MNFGEKLKRIRTEKNLTQPQFAEAIGIEQSYLSKLENDKSLPSAEMFTTIVTALELDPKAFLGDIDKQTLHTTLRHIPEVSQFLNGAATSRIHDARKYWYGAAAACALGFALMLAANDGIFYSNTWYKYESKGVIRDTEADNIYDRFKEIVLLKMLAKTITFEERSRLMAEFETDRVRPLTVEYRDDHGSVFVEKVAGGRRKFDLAGTRHARPLANKVLQYLGALFAFCGVLALFVEWRVRRIAANAANELK